MYFLNTTIRRKCFSIFNVWRVGGVCIYESISPNKVYHIILPLIGYPVRGSFLVFLILQCNFGVIYCLNRRVVRIYYDIGVNRVENRELGDS